MNDISNLLFSLTISFGFQLCFRVFCNQISKDLQHFFISRNLWCTYCKMFDHPDAFSLCVCADCEFCCCYCGSICVGNVDHVSNRTNNNQAFILFILQKKHKAWFHNWKKKTFPVKEAPHRVLQYEKRMLIWESSISLITRERITNSTVTK